MKLVCMDLDGTLEDSRADIVAAIKRVRVKLGVRQRSGVDLRPHVSRGMRHLYETCFDDCGGLDAAPDFLADYLANIAVQTKLYAGIAETLPVLAERYPLAVVTNKPEEHSRALLEALGVAQHFQTVVGGDSAPAPKPDPVMIRTALERSGHEAAIMIGDSNGDLRMAAAAGCRSIWCAWGYIAAPSVDFTARAWRPDELPKIVARFQGT